MQREQKRRDIQRAHLVDTPPLRNPVHNTGEYVDRTAPLPENHSVLVRNTY